MREIKDFGIGFPKYNKEYEEQLINVCSVRDNELKDKMNNIRNIRSSNYKIH